MVPRPQAEARPGSADRAFHLQLNEAAPLHRVLHRQRPGDRLDEAVDDHAHGLALGEPAAHQVEELVVADLGDRGLVADAGVALADLHVGLGLGDRLVVEQKGVAAHERLGTVGALVDVHLAPVGGDPAVLGDGLRHDRRGGLGGDVVHLGPGVLVLAGAGVGDRKHLAAGLGAHQVDRRVLHGQPGADVAVDPLDVRFGLGPGPLRHQVVDVGGPVLDGRVRDARTRQGHELDHGRVQRVGRVHRSRAPLDVVHLGALVGDDQRALELAHVLGVDPEVGLQRHVDLDARRDVDERATRPHGRVQRGELVVVGRDDLAEPLAHDIGVLAHRRVHVAEEDALLLEVLPVAVEHDLGLVLRGDAGKVLALCLGDTQLLVGVLDRVGQVLPLVDLVAGRLDVVEDVVEVEVRHLLGEPRRHRLALEVLRA